MNTDLTISELLYAYQTCMQNKKNSKSTLEFSQNLTQNIYDLFDELVSNTYKPSKSICFVVTYPKIREVWAADFRDRIVHHLIYNRYAKMFHNAFIHDSYACIPEKGTLKAAERVEYFMRSASQNYHKETFFLKADIANFFMSINKNILEPLIFKKVTDPWWQNLIHTIIFNDPRENYQYNGNRKLLQRVPNHKSLFNAPKHKGLPIGNLTSQLFAKIAF